MKTAGDVLSAFFDEQFVEKAHGYSNLFNSWSDITAKNGIAAAAAHSRIKELEKGIVLIEMDHPGWKQILQTKQSKLLNDFRYRFPKLNIMGISLMLGKPDCGKPLNEEPPIKPMIDPDLHVVKESSVNQNKIDKSVIADIETIKNEDLREKLIKLGQAIAERESRT